MSSIGGMDGGIKGPGPSQPALPTGPAKGGSAPPDPAKSAGLAGVAGLVGGAASSAADAIRSALAKQLGISTQPVRDPALDPMRSGAATLQKGAKGPAVQSLQQQLNAAGANPPLALDGKLGPATEAALRQFQQAKGIAVDGVVGPQTMGQIDGGSGAPAPKPAGGPTTVTPTTPATAASATGFAPAPGRANGPFAADAAARKAQAEDLLKANGQWPPKEGRVYALQVDQDSPAADASRADRRGYLKSYSGQTVVFKVENGELVEKGGPFKSASHPGQMTTSGFTDVNKDGKSDIAHLRSGVYEYRSKPNATGRYNPTNNRDMKVGRDLNQDGVISGEQENADYHATGLQIHAGGRSGPSSVGCQTMPPSDYAKFQQAIKSGEDGTFTYLLARRANDVHGENVMPSR